MLFRQMKYFMAVVDAKSFTEASYALEISQSAVSQPVSYTHLVLTGTSRCQNDQTVVY